LIFYKISVIFQDLLFCPEFTVQSSRKSGPVSTVFCMPKTPTQHTKVSYQFRNQLIILNSTSRNYNFVHQITAKRQRCSDVAFKDKCKEYRSTSG